MKLSELLFETNILLEEETFVVRKTPDGRRWGVYNTTSGTSVFISGHKSEGQAERAAEKLRNPVPPTPRNNDVSSNDNKRRRRSNKPTPAAPETPDTNVKAGRLTPGVAQGTGSKNFFVYLPDGKSIVENIETQEDAEKLFEYAKELDSQGKTPNEIAKAVRKPPPDVIPTARISKLNVAANVIKRNIVAMNIAEFQASQLSPRVARWWNGMGGKFIKALGRAVQAIEIPLGVFLGMAAAIDQIDKEKAEPGANVEDLQREQDIIAGNAYVMFISMILPLIRSVKRLRQVLGILKVVVRTGVVAAGAVGGTAVAPVAGTLLGGAAGFVLTELSFAAIALILSMPSTHRWMAEAIASTVLGDLMEWVGQKGNAAMSKVSEMLEGKYGTGFLVRSFSTEMQTSGGIEGDYYSDSEWAKLVFGSLMFGEDQESKFVPYIPDARREELLNETLSQSQTPETNAQPETPETSEPGLPANPDAPAVPQ